MIQYVHTLTFLGFVYFPSEKYPTDSGPKSDTDGCIREDIRLFNPTFKQGEAYDTYPIVLRGLPEHLPPAG